MFQEYDVIVVGAGHAGCEAAAAAANLGERTLLLTMNMQTIAQMSCNPAMGGIAKGQIVREIDALGGYSGIVTDRSMIQFRMLNKSKGPAMWSPRAQSDRMLFAQTWREMLESTDNLDFYQDSVTGLIIEREQVTGVTTALGHSIKAKSVVVTTGTFLNGLIHIGEKNFGGGRMAERASGGITEQLVGMGFESDRLKTGTPPRVDGRSLDYSQMEEQRGDSEITGFSYLERSALKPEGQRSCWITYTNSAVHDLLKSGFDKSPMYQGRISGTGPRYCPSIEDKIGRFTDRERHQLFVEPEGFNTIEIYINGFSTSLPEDVQLKALRLVPGFQNCKLFRPGYAIEYDYFPPTQLKSNLETKAISGLFFAGQINGTTGYEEAACQGLIAGINAHRRNRALEPFSISRSEGYIGVLIDDLINKGTDEPYRMFTSRAEFRTLLRQDNADLRLTEKSNRIGLAKEERMRKLESRKEEINMATEKINAVSIAPDLINEFLSSKDSAILRDKQKLGQLLSRPNINIEDILAEVPEIEKTFAGLDRESIQQAEIQLKYSSYLKREEELAGRMKEMESLKIPPDFNYEKLVSLGTEARQKLNKIRPETLGQAGRISGINPSDIQMLMVYMGR